MLQLAGIHHVTAVTADVVRNRDFYTGVLGLRLVKKTVNQDDVSAYHLFYADGEGSPGTDLTFFDWALPPERRGTRSIVRTMLRVGSEASLHWWEKRLSEAGGVKSAPQTFHGRLMLDFQDFEGQRLSLMVDESGARGKPWAASPVPAEHQVLGLGPVRLSVPDWRSIDEVLTKVLNMRHAREYAAADAGGETIHVYEMGQGGAAAELHVEVEPGVAPAKPGAGGAHHVAFRTTEADYNAWAGRLAELEMPTSGPVNRHYFQSLYFREPNGILFEIATDEPGFAVDEDKATMGTRLALPPFLEGRRREIEAGLKPL